jgi:hypothetical protein
MHLPRSVFSRKQLDLFLWLLRVNKVDDVPSPKSLTTINRLLQNMCGIETLAYDGKLGHRYHINNLAQILAQVCPVLPTHFTQYPHSSLGDLQPQSNAFRTFLPRRCREDTR